MKNLITIASLIFFSLQGQAQNLLPNSSFNERNVCPEYQSPCAPKGWFAIPLADRYLQPALGYDGRNSVEYLVHDPHSKKRRSFLETELLCPLRKDSSYVVELAIYGDCVIPNTLSVLFTEKDMLYFQGDPTSLQPAVTNGEAYPLMKTDRRYWYRLRLPFIATGKERFMVIGNFSRAPVHSECLDGERLLYTLDEVTLKPRYFEAAICTESVRRLAILYGRTERHTLLQEKINATESWNRRPIRVDSLVMPDVLFASGRATVGAEAEKLLTNFFRSYAASRIDSIRVEGHTDSVGSALKNEQLSRERAANVGGFIQQYYNYAPFRLRTVGWGSARPFASNASAEGRRKNRRVVIYLYRKED